MIKTFKRLALAIITLFAGIVSYAQVTTSAINGRVVDAQGAPLEGVAVIASHLPSGTVYGAITNSDGRYTIQGMRSGGPYKVEVSCLGYQSVEYTDITLKLAESYGLNAQLSDASEFLSEAKVIAAPTSKFALEEKTGATTNISNADILTLPSTSRSITDIAKLSPYGGNGMNIAGGDGRSANFTVDGANFNNNFGLSSTLPGGGMPISMDAIEEVQIVVSPFDVRQSNFIGGGVNAITKSGTNTVKGTAYVYHQNGKLRGTYVDGDEVTQDRDEKETVYGATVGFPILKNKLFFFGSFEYTSNPTMPNYWRPSTNGVADKDAYISRTTVADMQRVSDFLKNTYGYDTGGWSNYGKTESNLKLLARIDWNISQKHHLAFRYNFTTNSYWVGTNGSSADFNDPTGIKGTRMSYNRLSQYSMAFVNSMYSMENNVHSFSFDLNSRLGDNLSNQLLVTWSNIEDVRGSDSDKFPFIDILNGYTGSIAGGDLKQTLEPYMAAGYELFTWYNGVHNRVLNAKDDITYYAGAHKLTAGASFEYQFADNAYMREGTGYYRFRSVDDLLNGAAPETVALTYGYGGNETPSARIRFTQVGLYGQDEWDVNDKLKVTAGVRFDTILYNNADLMTNNAIYAVDFGGKKLDTGKWPATNVQVSPRIGFTYDIFGDKSLKVRGGTGLFAGRLPLVYMTNMPSNAAMFQHLSVMTTQYNTDGTIAARNPNLDAFAASANGGKFPTATADILAKLNKLDPANNPTDITPKDGALQSTVNGVDPNFKMPQVWKTSLALDMRLPTSFPFSMTAEGTFNKTINGTLIANWNNTDNTTWPTWSGPDNRHVYGTYSNYTKYPCYVLTNTNKGYGWIFVLSASAEPVKNLKINASYTHTEQYEVTGMPGNNAESVFTGLPTVDGPNFAVLHGSQYVRPDRLMASVSYRLPIGTTLSVFYQGYTPTGNSYLYSNDVNGDGVKQDLIYIPATKDEIKWTSAAEADKFWNFLEQDSYLSTHKGQYAESYAVHAPMVHYVDLRATQDFKIRIGKSVNTLQLSCDLMNVGNLLNNSWGAINIFDESVNEGQILTMDHLENGEPVFKTNFKGDSPKTWNHSHSVGSLWYLQLGLKYMFN
ncbi:MAG: TonB-dependent receptor [Bacteroidales bacterium]|nr:TonB-dependent receptor [Bacteroidales bacterium]